MIELTKDQLIQIFKKMATNNGAKKQENICGTFSGSMIATIYKLPKYMGRYGTTLEHGGKLDYECMVSVTNSFPGSCRQEVHIDQSASLTKSEYEFLVEKYT